MQQNPTQVTWPTAWHSHRSPQLDISLLYQKTDVGLVHCMVWLFTPQHLQVLTALLTEGWPSCIDLGT